MRGFWQDLRYGVRLLRRSPAFATTAVLVLALGIGVNTALFSIVNALFFTPLPVRNPQSLIYLYTTSLNGNVTAIGQQRREILEAQGADLADFTSHNQARAGLSTDDETQATATEVVDGRYFSVLGVAAARGRVLEPIDEDPANPERAVVISHDLWVRRFHADPTIVGQQIRLHATIDGVLSFTIIGVTPPGFHGVSAPWTPTQLWICNTSKNSGGWLIVRLRPNTTSERFNAFLTGATETVKETLRHNGGVEGMFRVPPQDIDRISFVARRAGDIRSPFEPNATLIPPKLLAALTGVVAIVLLIATANVAGLLLARGIGRTGEVAVRRALGAGSGRLTRQLLTETMILTGTGGVFGVVVAWNVIAVFRAMTPPVFALEVRLDLRVLLFAGVACAGTGVLAGLAPAFQARRVNILEALANGIGRTRRTRARLRHGIVIPQIAFSLVLLVVAAVLVRALSKLEQSDFGYRTQGAIIVGLNRWDPRTASSQRTPTDEDVRAAGQRAIARSRSFAQAVLARVGQEPELDAIGLTDTLPFASRTPSNVLRRDGTKNSNAAKISVSGGYFEAFGLPQIAGRAFDRADIANDRNVVVISASVATALWPGENPVGRALAFASEARFVSADNWQEVIGVVGDAKPILGARAEQGIVYFPGGAGRWLVVRGRGPESVLIPRVKAAVLAADPFAEVTSIQTSKQIVDDILYPRRAAAIVLVGAGIIGVLLSAIGLYGLLSYSVAQRQREIGIRATLGAKPEDLVRLVLREGARVTAIGAAAGLLIAFIALRIAASLTSGLPLVDPVSVVAVLAILSLVVWLACYLPARRAGLVDPVQVLRGS
jgi:predicted permease